MVFQELCRKLTGFEIAGASLLDEASAAAEAMLLAWGSSKGKANKYYVDEGVFPSSIRVMKTNADQLGIEVIVTDITKVSDSDLQGACGIHMQSPDNHGKLRDWTDRIASAKSANDKLVASIGSDLAALMLFKNPGEMGADISYGNTQRFGVPMGYGGPAASFFCTRKSNIRKLPGRIIGLSQDRHGTRSYRMALQTREQHIRREKATSNICTA